MLGEVFENCFARFSNGAEVICASAWAQCENAVELKELEYSD